MIKMRLLHICKMKNNLFFCKNSERIYAKDHKKYVQDHTKYVQDEEEPALPKPGPKPDQITAVIGEVHKAATKTISNSIHRHQSRHSQFVCRSGNGSC